MPRAGRAPEPEARGARRRDAIANARRRSSERPGVPRRSRDARSRDSTAARSPRDGTGRDARGVRHRSASAIERFFRSPAGSGARAPGTAASTHRRATEARGATARTAAADMVRAAILIDVVRAEMANRSSRARRKSSQHAGDANPAGGRWRAAWQPRRDEPIRRARLDGKKRWGLEPPNEGSRSTRNEETLTRQTTVERVHIFFGNFFQNDSLLARLFLGLRRFFVDSRIGR